MRTFGLLARNISAAAVVHGPSVLEPSAETFPLSAAVAVAAVISAATNAKAAITLFFITPLSLSL